ncbi:MAG: nitroreductase family protein [Bacteroidales bacterium]|jgi:nitroreductase|nr:nitroreductase family protein [Bacteroidales bacterium]HOI32559.1 nitroreductase family protein [Bacteroidales bacterium]
MNNMTHQNKTAETKFGLHPVLLERWSPRAFSDRSVEPEKIYRFLDAARWSPSASNEQPWRFIIGIKGDDTYRKMYDTFIEFNQLWTKTAPVLILNLANTLSTKNPGKLNPTYAYDLGQAVAHLSFQAHADGLYAHQMSGFDTQQAGKVFEIPDHFKVISVVAVGYIGNPEVLHPNLKKLEYADRSRRPWNENVFSNKFGQSFSLF